MTGDVLAAGGHRAQFPPAGGRISEEKWKEMFDGFDAEEFKRNGYALSTASGDAGAQSGEAADKPIVVKTGI